MDMTREDFRSVRHLLRFAAMGVTPAPDVVERAADRVSAHLRTLPEVSGSIERIRAGILPSQEVCVRAEQLLSRYFEDQGPSEVEGQHMTHH